jgi:hypothetical protein
MEAINSSEMSGLLQTMWHYNLEDCMLDIMMVLLFPDSQCKQLYKVYHKKSWLNVVLGKSQVEMKDTE